QDFEDTIINKDFLKNKIEIEQNSNTFNNIKQIQMDEETMKLEQVNLKQPLKKEELSKLLTEKDKAKLNLQKITQYQNQIQTLKISQISQKPKFNEETQKIIDQIKNKFQKNNNQTPTEAEVNTQKIFNNPVSLKQRYEYLLKEQQEFPLPNSYQELIDTFNKIEQCIDLFKQRNKPLFLQNIKNNMEKVMRTNLTIQQIQQIIYLYPQAYKLNWSKNEFLRINQDLYFDMNQEEKGKSIQERVQHFKNVILEKVKQLHDEFLKNNGLIELKEDLEQSFQWHKDFKLENLPQIELGSLPVQRRFEEKQGDEDYKRENDIAYQIIKKELLMLKMKKRKNQNQFSQVKIYVPQIIIRD
ncbi:hypothetical protein IMG5_015470, partial [Ichthyophthirius multifiliis]